MRLTLILLATCAAGGLAAEVLKVPFVERFGPGPLPREWQVDLSGTNTIVGTEDGLRITAAENTYAHVQRPLGADGVRVKCTLQPRGGVSWVSSLFLYWDPRNWCQVSVLAHELNYYAVGLVDGELREYRRPLAAKADWDHLAIALGKDCVRFQASADGASWNSWLVVPRPEAWCGRAPALLVLGKGFSRGQGEPRYPAPDLNNDYADRGPVTVSLIREVGVEAIPAGERRLTAAERRQFATAGRDTLGDAELATRADPSFDSVSRHFPPMKYPRESLGVKDGPQEFVVLPDATLDFAGVNAGFRIGTPPTLLAQNHCTRRLEEGCLPIVHTAWEQEGLKFGQTAFGWSVGFDPDAPLSAMLRLQCANPGPADREITLRFGAPDPGPAWEVRLPAGGQASVYVQVPFDHPARAVKVEAAEFEGRLQETAAWWRAQLAQGMRVEVPEERVNHAWRAWLAYNYINVDKRGDVFEPHDGGGGFYELVYGYSASRYAYALDVWGFPRDAQRYLDSILSFVTPEGLLMVNYGLPDTGTQLWAMSEHYQYTRDEAWLRRVAPQMIKMCDWVIAQRRSSMSQSKPDAPWYGLLKYRPYCDEETPAYSYHTDTYLALGLRSTAAALRQLGMTSEADRIGKEAAAYQACILRSMDRATFVHHGTKLLPMFPETRALLKRVGYTGADYYSLVSSMVLETELLAPADRRARRITDLLENQGGLSLGTAAFDGGIDHAYTYGYWMNCLQLDDVKRVILGFYTSLAYGMSRGTYAGVEVTRHRTGDNYATLPHLYSGTQQLLLLRNMLIREDGEDLWLGQAIPRPWFKDGEPIRVENAPTRFGRMSFSIQTEGNARRIVAEITPPADRIPRRIHLRIRHPQQRPIAGVTVDGQRHRRYQGETVELPGAKQPVRVEVRYD